MKIYQDRYNTQYGKNVNFYGKLEAYSHSNGNYLVRIDLTVVSNNEIDYNFSKEFLIQKTNKYINKTLSMGEYKFINILDDIDLIINSC